MKELFNIILLRLILSKLLMHVGLIWSLVGGQVALLGRLATFATSSVMPQRNNSTSTGRSARFESGTCHI